MAMLVILIATVAFVAPLHWAASYADADDSTYQKCFLLSIASGAIQAILDAMFLGSFGVAFVLGTIVAMVMYVKVLKIPGSNVMMFAVMLIFFRVVLAVGLGMIAKGAFSA